MGDLFRGEGRDDHVTEQQQAGIKLVAQSHE